MSIQREVERIKQNVSNAYNAVLEKGGSVPELANSENLAAAIATIPSGVNSFNGRIGDVIPQAKDYDKFFAYPLYAYDGVNIKDKFKGEMDFTTEPWEWIRQRCAARDLSGLHIKDFFEVAVKDNSKNDVLIQAQMGGINHDMGFAPDGTTAFHIDFISKDVWPELHVWNKATYNNGLEVESNPWLCSDLYAWLNSKKTQVPNAAAANPVVADVDYTTTGVFDKLPASLQSLIVERHSMEPCRFNASGLLTDDISFAWKNIGKLWVPNETEVYGQIVWGTQNGYSVGAAHQFPIFMDGRTRIKRLGTGGDRYYYWLRSVCSGNSTDATDVSYSGIAGCSLVMYGSAGAPICFRLSG